MERRTFLAVSGSLVAGLLLPSVRGGNPAVLDALHRRAQETAAAARDRRSTATLREATDLLIITEAAVLAVPREADHRRLQRSAALAALVAAQAAQRAHHPAADLIATARGHATGAGDGPLLAQALVLQRDEAPGSGEALELLRAALVDAGTTRETASLRAAVLYRLAWERAAAGDALGALQELEGANASAALAVPAPDHVEAADLRRGGADAWRGKVLARTGRPTEAQDALSTAVSNRSQPADALADLAKLHAAAGDVDTAAAALEDAFLLANAAGSRRAETKVRRVAGTLPDSAAVRSLAALIQS